MNLIYRYTDQIHSNTVAMSQQYYIAYGVPV